MNCPSMLRLEASAEMRQTVSEFLTSFVQVNLQHNSSCGKACVR